MYSVSYNAKIFYIELNKEEFNFLYVFNDDVNVRNDSCGSKCINTAS